VREAGAQTVCRRGAGPVRALLGGKDLTGRRLSASLSSIPRSRSAVRPSTRPGYGV